MADQSCPMSGDVLFTVRHLYATIRWQGHSVLLRLCKKKESPAISRFLLSMSTSTTSGGTLSSLRKRVSINCTRLGQLTSLTLGSATALLPTQVMHQTQLWTLEAVPKVHMVPNNFRPVTQQHSYLCLFSYGTEVLATCALFDRFWKRFIHFCSPNCTSQ
jgi:hypothetical protein